MKFIRNVLISALLLGATPMAVAEDAEIYIGADAGEAGEALVMLNIDWRPNLSSQVCQSTLANGDNECLFLVQEGHMRSDGAATPGVPGDIVFYELIVAALKAAIDPLPGGVAFGIMVNHEHDQGCVGPSPPTINCSNGGYVFKGFTSIDTDETTHTCPLWDSAGAGPDFTDVDPLMAEFCAKLDIIPFPKGGASHKFQGEEHFFEFFRYLTGQGIFNGHLGWNDYGTSNDPDEPLNLDDVNDTFNGIILPAEVDPTTANVAELQWDDTIESGPNYISPIDIAGDCASIYTINFMFQVSQQAADSDAAIEAAASAGGMGINISARNPFGPDRGFTNVLNFLFQTDLAPETGAPYSLGNIAGEQNVTSFFLVPENQINNTTEGYADAGSGGVKPPLPLTGDPRLLVDALTGLLGEILSTSTTFVAPSIPANVFNRTELLPDFYMALFQAQVTPFWEGNLKKLELSEDSNGNLLLVDVNGDAAVGLNGRISPNALTFWTDPNDLPLADPAVLDMVDGKDGPFVTRGGAGSRIPGFEPGDTPQATNGGGGRLVYTSPLGSTNGTPVSLVSTPSSQFDASLLRAQELLTNDDRLFAEAYEHAFGTTCVPSVTVPTTNCTYTSETDPSVLAAVEGQVIELTAFTRGIDVDDLDIDGDMTDARPWMVGAPPHSRPVPIVYGLMNPSQPESATNPVDIRILMGTNDGVMHLFQNKTASGAESGVESWAFIPREIVPDLYVTKDNIAGGTLSFVSPSTRALHPYLLDGEPSVLVIDLNSDGQIEAGGGDRVIAFFGQRRGGKDFYALDISDPDDPKILWRIEKGASGDFAEMGQSWSAPRIGVINVDDGTVRRLIGLFLTGGYNGNDYDNTTNIGKDARDDGDPTFIGIEDGSGNVIDDDEGNAMFIINALNGDLIWKAVQGASTGPTADSRIFHHTDLHDSAPSGPTLVDTNGDGSVDRYYYADTGGILWRGDIPGALREGAAGVPAWTLTPVFSAGRHYSEAEFGTARKADDRRFFHRPDVVLTSDELGPYDGVVFTSGDRAHPLGTEVENFAYLFRDRATTSGSPPGGTVMTHAMLADLTDNCLQDDDSTDCGNGDPGPDGDVDPNLPNGWRIQLNQCFGTGTEGNCGEKGLANPLIENGAVFFSTYLPVIPGSDPAVAQCGPAEGGGLLYGVALDDASSVINFNDLVEDSLVPGGEDRFDELQTPGIPSDVVDVGTSILVGGEDVEFEGNEVLKAIWYEQVLQ